MKKIIFLLLPLVLCSAQFGENKFEVLTYELEDEPGEGGVCSAWNHPSAKVLSGILDSLIEEPNMYVIMDYYNHYDCRIKGELMYNGVKFDYYLNAGGTLILENDTSEVYFGSGYNEKLKKYFITIKDSTLNEGG